MLPPTPASEICVLDIVEDRKTGKRGVVFRMRPLYPTDAEPIHVVMQDREELWFSDGELTVIGKAIP